MTINTGVTVTVYADSDYYYEACVGDRFVVNHVEVGRDRIYSVGFKSVEEMEAVANAMLRAIEMSKTGSLLP